MLLKSSCGIPVVCPLSPFHHRRDSDKCTQLDDLLMLWTLHDSVTLIYCEASEFFKLPPISPNPLAEQVLKNSKALNSLVYICSELSCILKLVYILSILLSYI